MHLGSDLSAAEREYQLALSLDPAQPIVHNNLGLIYLGRGELDEAESALRAEIVLNPSYDKAHFNLGLVLARRVRVQEAAAEWREAVRLNPLNEEARRYVEQADQFTKTGDLGSIGPSQSVPIQVDQLPTDVLKTLYERALERDPANKAIRQGYEELCRKRQIECRS